MKIYIFMIFPMGKPAYVDDGHIHFHGFFINQTLRYGGATKIVPIQRYKKTAPINKQR